MKISLQSQGRKIVALSLTLFFGIYAGWIILKPYLVDRQINNLLTGKDVQKPLPFNPEDSLYYYLLGRYFQYSPLIRDFKKAKDSYISAILLNPVKAEYWVDLARVEDTLDNSIDAEKAINRALELKPAGLNIHWEASNFWLKRGKLKEALKSFRYIIFNFPEERRKAYLLLWLATKGDLKVILNEAIPEEIGARTDYLWYLASRGQREEAKKVWNLTSGTNLQPSVRLRYIDHLISWGDIDDARREWRSLKGGGEDSKNLIWNGGFEEKETLDKGFDWRIGRVTGADITIDNNKVKEGNYSLRIDFDGKENVDFFHISQTVPLKPERRYILTALIMTDSITTTNGIKIDFSGFKGCNFYRVTEPITGTNPWKELKIEVKIPQDCKAGRVRIRREKSSKFNNLIGGTVWIDEVGLKEMLPDSR